MLQDKSKLVHRYIIGIAIVILFKVNLIAQPFPCDGNIMLSYNQGNAPTFLVRVDFGPFGAVFYSPVATYTDGAYDALGFNPQDNFIYAVRQGTNQIYRLKRNNTTELVGEVSIVDSLQVGAGDCTPDGRYICYDKGLNQLLIFNVLNGLELIDRVDLEWSEDSPNMGPFESPIEALSVDPTNPAIAYFHQAISDEPNRTRGFLHSVTIDPDHPDYGIVNNEALLTDGVVGMVGGLTADRDGGLFGYGMGTRQFDLAQDRFISINKIVGQATPLGTGAPFARVTDGCSCPYNITFTKMVDPLDVLCTDSELTYNLVVDNRFLDPIEGALLTDTLPKEMVITAIEGDLRGVLDPMTGVGTNVITISDINIPSNGSMDMIVTAKVIDIEIRLIKSQASLNNLSERMGSLMFSDDPLTLTSFSDSTSFYGRPQLLEEIAIDINHPTECINPTDGWVELQAPELITGESYQVTLRDENYEMDTWNVTIDENNSFRLDTILPGEYELFQIKPQTSNCSFAMKDTTIDVVGPNETIQIDADSNGPVCKGDALRFFGTAEPADEIEWNGPFDYWSIENDPVIGFPTEERSGTYYFSAIYGECERVDSVEIFVAPQINGTVDGILEYCARDTLQLRASGEGEELDYRWVLPTQRQIADSILIIANTSTEDDGTISAIISNGICADTIDNEVVIKAAPIISMTDQILTDYCDPIQLDPTIVNDNSGTYDWHPQEGLSCSDCPNPDVSFPIQRQYELTVRNDNNCADSATVNIGLIKEKLLYVPNAFSPNGDGINDRFSLSPGCALQQIEQMVITDRWGTKVFTAKLLDDFTEERFWNGDVRGQPGQVGTYSWALEFRLVDNSLSRSAGTINLIR